MSILVIFEGFVSPGNNRSYRMARLPSPNGEGEGLE